MIDSLDQRQNPQLETLKTLYGSNLTNVGHINDDEPRRGYTFDRGSREPNA